jgi:hypothetical protein
MELCAARLADHFLLAFFVSRIMKGTGESA